MDVPTILREAIELTGLTQSRFARKTGVSQGTISKWISGQVSPNKSQWDDVLKVLARDSRTQHLAAGDSRIALVPLLDWASAVQFADPDSQIPASGVPLLAFTDLGRGDFFTLRIEDDAMDRLSAVPGSTVVVNRDDRDLTPDKGYVFSLGDKAIYRLWQPDPPHLAPYSTNPVHKPIFIKGRKGPEVVGRVVRTMIDL